VAIQEFRATATKVTVKDDEVHFTSAVDGGKTVRVIYGLAPLAAVITALQENLRESK
jgi:hypothetical protein